MKSELSRRLDIGREMEQYDAHCKNILADKRMLAWILKETLQEFHSMQIDDIMEYIEGTPDISSVPVDPGMTNSPVIRGMNTEDRTPNEGVVFFDIRFFVSLPGERKGTGLIVNLEAQRDMRPGYSIVTRGIFYEARMISSQMGTEFTAPHYDKIKKVVSIWICFHSPDSIGNAVARYVMKKEDLVSGLPDIPEEYDKQEVILICLNARTENHIRLTELLNLVFNSRLAYEEKVKILKDNFGFPMEIHFGEELRSMCNVSEYILEQALEEGLQQGIQKGMQQGMQRGLQRGRQGLLQEIVRNMLREEYEDQQIMKLCGITSEQLEKIKRAQQRNDRERP